MISLPNKLLKECHHKEDKGVGTSLSAFFDGDFHFGSSRPTGKVALVWQESQDGKDAWRCSTFGKTYEGGWTSNSINETHWSTGDITLHRKGRVTLKEFDADKPDKDPFWAKEWRSMGVFAWTDDAYAFDVRNCMPVQSFVYDVLFNFESPFPTATTPKHVVLCINSNAPLTAGCKKVLHDLLYVKSARRTRFLRNAFKNKGLHEDTPLQIIVRAPHYYLSEHAVKFLKAPLDLSKPLHHLVFMGRSHEQHHHHHHHETKAVEEKKPVQETVLPTGNLDLGKSQEISASPSLVQEVPQTTEQEKKTRYRW
jgi:hypothetical protein